MDIQHSVLPLVRGRTAKGQFERGFLYPEKTIRDVKTLRREARCIIVSDSKGTIIEKKMNPVGSNGKLLVVLTQASYQGSYYKEAVALEIGFRRAVPYQAFEFRTSSGRVQAIKSRHPIATLPDEAWIKLVPEIGKAIQEIVDEEVLRWKRVLWTRAKGEPIARGLFITLPKNVPLFAHLALVLDQYDRSMTNIALRASLIKAVLKKYDKTGLSDKAFKNLKGVQSTVLMLRKANYDERSMEELGRKLGNPSRSMPRAHFERICELFDIKPRAPNGLFQELMDMYDISPKEAKKLLPLSFATHPKRDNRRGSHARGCVRVEVRPSFTAIQKVEERAAVRAMEHGHRIEEPVVAEGDIWF